MGKRSSRQQLAYLPLALCATFLVMVCPVILVWWLRDSGAVTSVWVGIGIGVAVSFGASYVGAALWKTRTRSQDVLFGELMLWGWVQRWRAERRLATATDVLGLRDGPRGSVAGGELTHEQRAGLLTQLASGLEARDPYTHGHSRRVARHASNIAKRMGLSAAEVAKIRTAGVIHDIGKVNISMAVLHKEGKLTDGEFEIVKRHPVEGATMVSPLGDDELTAMVRHHHERLDGTGYPNGLAGDAIPLGARILAVADTFDAITSTRPYRPAHAHKKAMAILTAEAGTQLDPDAVRAFCSYYAGRRPLALWTIVANGPPRLASWLGGGLTTAQAASVANVAGIAAATGALGAAALPVVKTPTPAPQAAQAATARAVVPSARQRPRPTNPTGDEGGRPANARGKGKGRGSGGRIAPEARQRPRNSDKGREATPAAYAPAAYAPLAYGPSGGGETAPGENRGQGGSTAPGVAPGKGKGKGNGNGKGNGRGQGDHGKGNRPTPGEGTLPRDKKPPPAGGKGDGGNPGGTSPGKGDEKPPRGPLDPVLGGAGGLVLEIDTPRKPEKPQR